MTRRYGFRIMLAAFQGILLGSALMTSGPVSGLAADTTADGAALYRGKCAMCHGPSGAGRPGNFPPLAGRVGQIARTPEGKAYLAAVLLNGLHGPIMADGQSYKGFMPAFRTLSDDEIAAVVTYAAGLGTASTGIAPSDVASARAQPMDAAAIGAKRQALVASHGIP